MNGELGAETSGAVAHQAQPETDGAGRRAGRVEPAAVVADREREPLRPAGDGDADGACLRVADGVVDGLDGNAEEGAFNVRVEARAGAARREDDALPARRRQTGQRLPKRTDQVELGEDLRIEAAGQV